MNERITKIRSDITTFWKSRSKGQKGTIIGSFLGVIILAAVLTFFLTKTEMVPLYSEVSPSEVGRIKENLDSKGIPNEIAAGGTSILVPEEQKDTLLVQMAAEGFPQSGMIDYSFFSQNAGFGMTDNEFNVLKLATTQTELANLIKSVEGVKEAKVMITLPEEGVFLSQSNEGASASIVLNTEPGYQFSEAQIASLYNLVSKSIPNLSTEDIVIRNQFLEYFDLAQANGSNGATVTDQMTLKKSIERDLQRQVQTMLGTLMGQDKVVVSVTTDIDFKQENREENLVEPVDVENMTGIEISAQRISETFTGNNPAAGGTPQSEDATDNFTNYVEGTTSDGDYERTEDTINNEVNRIRKEIVESPYKIRDIGIQVMVEPPDAEDVTSLPEDIRGDIEQMLATIVRTSIDKGVGELTEEQVEDKILVSVQELKGKNAIPEISSPTIPWWIYVIGGILLVAIILLVISLLRSRRSEEEDEELIIIEEAREIPNVDDINNEKETESTLRRKQLEKMAKDKPDEFAKLLRTWIAED